jgi:hypothetical protein
MNMVTRYVYPVSPLCLSSEIDKEKIPELALL